MGNPSRQVTREFDISELVRSAKSTQEGPDIYSNHVVATVNDKELVIDFYQLSPKPGDTLSTPLASHRQRIILPHAIIPGLKKLFEMMLEHLVEMQSLNPQPSASTEGKNE